MVYIQENLEDEMAAAKDLRLDMLGEQVFQATNAYKKMQSKPNLDAVVGLQKTYDSVKKQQEAQKPFNMIFNRAFPDSTWDSKENPLEKEFDEKDRYERTKIN